MGAPLGVHLLEVTAVSPDVELELVRQGVHARHAHTVKATGHLVAAGVELAAGMQHRHHDLGGRTLLLGVHVGGDAPPVVGDGARAVVAEHDADGVAVAGHRFIDGVVDHFVDAVMKAADVGAADVHGGTLADGGEALEDLDAGRLVVVLGAGGLHAYALACRGRSWGWTRAAESRCSRAKDREEPSLGACQKGPFHTTGSGRRPPPAQGDRAGGRPPKIRGSHGDGRRGKILDDTGETWGASSSRRSSWVQHPAPPRWCTPEVDADHHSAHGDAEQPERARWSKLPEGLAAGVPKRCAAPTRRHERPFDRIKLMADNAPALGERDLRGAALARCRRLRRGWTPRRPHARGPPRPALPPRRGRRLLRPRPHLVGRSAHRQRRQRVRRRLRQRRRPRRPRVPLAAPRDAPAQRRRPLRRCQRGGWHARDATLRRHERVGRPRWRRRSRCLPRALCRSLGRPSSLRCAPTPSVLLRNEGDGTFTDVSHRPSRLGHERLRLRRHLDGHRRRPGRRPLHQPRLLQRSNLRCCCGTKAASSGSKSTPSSATTSTAWASGSAISTTTACPTSSSPQPTSSPSTPRTRHGPAASPGTTRGPVGE